MQYSKQKVLVVIGTTASGKTTLAVSLARKFNGEIVSADSRQVYRGLDIGTGKDLEAYAGKIQSSKFKVQKRKAVVPYHLIDVVSPRTQFTLADYQRRAYKAIDDILRRGKVPIICGGTGLYISAVLEGYVLPQARSSKLEARKLRKRFSKMSRAQLLRHLKQVDSETHKTIDQKNRRRIERALEIYYQTGNRKGQRAKRMPPPYTFLILGLTFPRPILKQKIIRRLNERLKSGLVKEVSRLHKQGVSWRRLDELGLEYRWVSRYLRGQINKTEMASRLSREIFQYAKRQLTWFKRLPDTTWVHAPKQAELLARQFLARSD